MISHLSLIVLALLAVSMIIVVQSIPLQAGKETLVSVKQSPTFEAHQEPNLALDQPLDEKKIETILHAQVKESPAQIHRNADEPTDLNNAALFTDVKMNPNELIHLQERRRRRQINRNDEFRQRRKRALSSFDFLDGDLLYQSWLEHGAFPHPTRNLDAIYRYPFLYERPSRSLLDSPEWNSIEDNPLDNGNFVESSLPWSDEYNRYPIVIESPDTAGQDWPLEEEYNIDDIPFPMEVNSDELVYLPDADEPTENYFQ